LVLTAARRADGFALGGHAGHASRDSGVCESLGVLISVITGLGMTHLAIPVCRLRRYDYYVLIGTPGLIRE
jgi:hypothetical protein